MRSEIRSTDGETVVELTCAEDVLTIFVGERAEIEDGEWYYRPDAPGNAGGRLKAANQESATSVSWQKLQTAAGESTVRGVYLPKRYRRSFVDALRADDRMIVDWFYGTDTFEWPEADTDYEPPLEACAW